MSTKSCVFCDILKNKNDNHTYNIVAQKTLQNLIIRETPNFYITLDISPVTENHCLIVSKRHTTAFTLLNNKEWPEFKKLLRYMRKKFFKIYGFTPTIFEHGTIHKQALRSGCMEHAHIHVLPLKHDVSKNIIQDGHGLSGQGSYLAMSPKFQKDSYLYYENYKNSGSFYNVEKMSSQYLRKVLARIIGKRNWNWKIRVKSSGRAALATELVQSHKFLKKHLTGVI